MSDAKTLAPLLDQEKVLNQLVIDTGDVKVLKGLRVADKGVLDWLHWSTEQHVKVYRCVIWAKPGFPSQDALNA
ncbi:hypothetical protein ACI3PL_30370, partial [Lacticaseibacillus paracasei]